ncbi:MAG TPA: HAD family hydrolase [Leucothrix mucor]|uniref:HAD family hydrolase n=1 Tax=Leucothrix mucor TaxID=45248 RepID=A0A7V2T3Z0_LEUMU|nr:HAD family hydrolase [Leucothrix mucor]
MQSKKSHKPIYALDFDGVICDSAIETGMTGWKTAQKIWQDMPKANPPESIINDFRQIRPFLETGYEAIIIVRLLQQGMTVDKLSQNYPHQINTLINEEQLNAKQLKQLFGITRDHWINQSPHEWLNMNPLFTGILQHLETLRDSTWYIITTKQKRFVEQILNNYQINIKDQHIYSMESKQSKQDTLLELSTRHPNQDIIFIEDRLPTLIKISKNTRLKNIKLQLVDWGYNTYNDRASAQKHPLEIITINQFLAK